MGVALEVWEPVSPGLVLGVALDVWEPMNPGLVFYTVYIQGNSVFNTLMEGVEKSTQCPLGRLENG
jgi:hypothetical protein